MSISSSLQSFGIGYSLFNAIAISVVGLIFIIFGLYFSNKKDEKDKKQNNKSIGIFIAFIGLLAIIGSWSWYWVAKKYKGVAEASGILGGVNIAEDIIDGK